MAKKIVLAYSGGLDTSVILKWLQNEYNAEIITYTSNLGQKINIKPAIADQGKTMVRLSALKKGIYYLTIRLINGHRYTHKFVKT